MAVGLVIIFLIYTNIFQYVPFVYIKLYLKQVYGNFPGSIHNKESAEISSVIHDKKIWFAFLYSFKVKYQRKEGRLKRVSFILKIIKYHICSSEFSPVRACVWIKNVSCTMYGQYIVLWRKFTREIFQGPPMDMVKFWLHRNLYVSPKLWKSATLFSPMFYLFTILSMVLSILCILLDLDNWTRCTRQNVRFV